MPILTAILAGTLTWAGERLLDSGVAHIKGRLADAAAKAELLEITRGALEDAIDIAPSLAEDLRSESFLHAVIWPTALDGVADPAVTIDALKLADGYVTKFVEPWVREGGEEKALSRIFDTDRATIVSALEVFVASLRKGLFGSEHWKEVGRDRTIEETHEGVAYLVQTQKRLERNTGVNLDMAKADARTGSQDLLDWQRTISGLFIARSELDLLANRIRTEPRGRTLLVGEAGSGKSALLSELTERLQDQGMTVFGLKADMLPADVLSTSDISRALGLRGDLEDELHLLAQAGPVVLLNREPADCNGWLAVLERHVHRADDPAIWAAILTYNARHLFWADRTKTLAFFDVVWKRFPEAFTLIVGQMLWSHRAMISPEVQKGFLETWASSLDQELAQGAGEFAVAAEIVDGEADILASMATDIMNGPASPQRLGGLFALASAWRHNAGGLRDRAHDVLVRFAPSAADDEAEAISTALDGDRILLPDAATEQMLRIVVDNEALLSAALNSRFADALQELLLHPGFEDVVLAVAEKGGDKLIADRNGGGGRGMIDGDFVSMAIALQRAPGTQRSRAMNLYERLLDAEVYGASEAAAATLRV